MKRFLPCILAFFILFSLSGCGSAAFAEHETSAPSTEQAVPQNLSDEELRQPEGEFRMETEDGIFTEDDGVYRIIEAGTYVLSGILTDGRIEVDAGETAEVELVLSAASISCESASPVTMISAASVKIKAEEETKNEICDLRSEEAEEGNAAVYAACDLSFAGKGLLVVSSEAGNGVQSKDNVKIKNISLQVNAAHHALKGNDEVKVESGNLLLVSEGGDGIVTSNSDLSSKGNQHGNVELAGGIIQIYAYGDGIDAACDVRIAADTELTIYTGTQSAYSGEEKAGSERYLVLSTELYSNTYSYYAYYYNVETPDSGVWIPATDPFAVYGGRTQYVAMSVSEKSGYSEVLFASTESGQSPDSVVIAQTESMGINENMNSFLINSLSGSTYSGDWVSLTQSTGGANSTKSQHSAKGIKAGNSVVMEGGSLTINADDDGIHANGDSQLESGAAAEGSIEILNGSVTIRSADDGIHADGELVIWAGTVSVEESYEGLEANRICIYGGTVSVYAEDDGLNACSGAQTPEIQITGGTIEVRTPSGDTDGIDSNGNYCQSGGCVVVKGGASQGNMMGSVDVDGSVQVTGGTILALGGICELPENSCNYYASSGVSIGAGTLQLLDGQGNVLVETTLDSTYSSFWICSESLALNGEYQLSLSGTAIETWTQTETSMGGSNYGFGGFGGFGGNSFGGPGNRPGRN